MSTYESPQFGEDPDRESVGPERLHPDREQWPSIDLTIKETTYKLMWDNTFVRRFRFGNGEFDYFLHETPDGDCTFIFLSQLEDDGAQLRQMLEDYSFPTRIDPVLDEETIDFYTRIQAGNLKDELSDVMPSDKE